MTRVIVITDCISTSDQYAFSIYYLLFFMAEKKHIEISGELYDAIQQLKEIFGNMAGKPIENDEDVLSILVSGFIDSVMHEQENGSHDHHDHDHAHGHHHGKHECACGDGECGNCGDDCDCGHDHKHEHTH